MKTVLKLFLISVLFFPNNQLYANMEADLYTYEGMFNLSHPEKRYIKVALLLDTSNSMDGLIDQAKAQLWEIVNELSYAKCKGEKPNLKIALYEYGNDNLNPDEGYIRQVIGFSDDLDEISKELFSLTTNGGSEYCGHVIQTSLNQLKWGNNPDDLKLIFIAGNEPFTQGRIHYKDAGINAKEKSVTVNTIFCGDYKQGIATYWRDGALITDGDYMAINHNQATVQIATPFDETILQLNIKLNKTYIGFGNHGPRKMALQAEQDSKARGYSKENAVSRTVSKSSHLYKNSSWDLVDAVDSESVELKDLSEDELPPELKGKTPAQIKAFIQKKKEERKSIQAEIQKLNKKRRTYISNHKDSQSNALESAMIAAIKAQAKQKQYEW